MGWQGHPKFPNIQRYDPIIAGLKADGWQLSAISYQPESILNKPVDVTPLLTRGLRHFALNGKLFFFLVLKAMIYFENASRGEEGFNTHVMSYTLAVSLSNFLGRDFYFDYEIPCSTPPDYALSGEFKDKFSILLNSERSLVSDLLEIPNRRVYEIDRSVADKLELQLVYSYFITTETVKQSFGNTIIWESFGAGRYDLTREHLESFNLIEWTHTKLSHLTYFYFLPRTEKYALLDSVQLRYLEPIEELAVRVGKEYGNFNAAHLRMGDFERIYRGDEFSIDPELFQRFVKTVFPDNSLPVLVATDGLQQKDMFRSIFDGYDLHFIDEIVFDNYLPEYGQLPFTDFNVLTIINQLLCAAAEGFIGTYRSTFTGIIHRLRQERYGKRDFNFFPDEKVARMLTPEGKIAPDRHGFFDWNRYSAFAEDHASMAWKREWDRELTAIG